MTSLSLVQATSTLTLDDAQDLQHLQDDDNRTAMYLHYFELTGEQQAFVQAKISSFSGFLGAAADAANQNIQQATPLYPTQGVIYFSNQISQDHITHVYQDVLQGGTGVFTGTTMQANARSIWDYYGIGPLFPGNVYNLTELIKHPLDVNWAGVAQAVEAGLTVSWDTLTLAANAYGVARATFDDPTTYQWYYKKVHNKSVSVAVERATGKVVFVEHSTHALCVDGIVLGTDTLFKDAIYEPVIPFKPIPKTPGETPAQSQILGPLTLDAERPPEEQEFEFLQFLNAYGLTPEDVSREEKKAIIALGDTYVEKKENNNWLDKIPFTFLEQAAGNLVVIATQTGNPRLYRAAVRMERGIDILHQCVLLPGAVAAAGPTLWAVCTPMMALGMAIFSFVSLFGQQSDPNQLQPIMDMLGQLSDKIDALHEELILAKTEILAGQQLILTTMIDQFRHVAKLIQYEHAQLGVAMTLNFERMDQFLSLIHFDLSSMVRQTYTLNFEQIMVMLSAALESPPPPEQRKTLMDWRLTHIAIFEDWIINKSRSGLLNGSHYVQFLVEHQMDLPKAQMLINRRLINENIHLECMVGYLGQIAVALMGKPLKLTGPDAGSLPNPTFWLKGATTYLLLRRTLSHLEIEHDQTFQKFGKIKKNGLTYVDFIKGLKVNRSALFAQLMRGYATCVSALNQNLKVDFGVDLLVKNLGFALEERGFFKAATICQYDGEIIKKSITNASLHAPILNFLSTYQSSLRGQVGQMQQRFTSQFSTLIEGLLNDLGIDQLSANLVAPLCPIARHKTDTAKGESYLEVYHAIAHFSRFEDYGFKIPLLLSNLFANASELKNQIPKILYLAEMLGLGNIEITMSARYVNDKANFPASHASLNQREYGNYKFIFELFFVTTQRIKFCEFDCHSDQLALSNHSEVAAIVTSNWGSMAKNHTKPKPPFDYWFLASVNRKLCAMNHIPKFANVARFNKIITASQEQLLLADLGRKIEAKKRELQSLYQVFIQNPLNQSIQGDPSEASEASINLALSFMHLCGFDPDAIQKIRKNHLALINPPAPEQVPMTLELFQADFQKMIECPDDQLQNKGYRLAEVELMLAAYEAFELEQELTESTTVIEPPLPQQPSINAEEGMRRFRELLSDLGLSPETKIKPKPGETVLPEPIR